jgi:hypothetical protein
VGDEVLQEFGELQSEIKDGIFGPIRTKVVSSANFGCKLSTFNGNLLILWKMRRPHWLLMYTSHAKNIP